MSMSRWSACRLTLARPSKLARALALRWRDLGFTVLTTTQLLARTPQEIAELVRTQVGDSKAFLSFDGQNQFYFAHQRLAMAL